MRTLLSCVVAAVAATAAGAECVLWPVSPLERVWPDSAAPLAAAGALELDGARAEVATAQLAVRAEKSVRLALRAQDLAGPGGARIPASAVRLFWERRIAITKQTPFTPREELDRAVPCEVPDPFWEGAERELAAGRTEGVWVEVLVPGAAPAGTWTGAVELLRDGAVAAAIPLQLTVFDFAVPKERHLAVTQWFTFPGVPFNAKVERYSEKWWALLAKFARIIAEHRQNSFQAQFDLVDMRLTKDGRYVGDFAAFDRWVETFDAAGRFDRIELGFVARLEGGGLTDPGSRMRPGKLPLRIEDPAMHPTDAEALAGWLAALREHLQAKGWLGRAMIHIHDEPFIQHEESYREIAALVARAAPGLRRIDAIETEDFFGSLEIWVPKLSHLANWYDTAYRRAKESGAELWFYTCCHPTGAYPNRFLDYPLAKARVLHWINYLYGMDGFLHWGLNHFTSPDPFSEAGVTGPLPPGDCAVCYPGEDGYLGSLRWSTMRDGLEDFEYLWVLEDRLRALKTRLGEAGRRLDPRQRPRELCRRVAWGFREYTRDGAVLLAARRAVAAEIEAVARGPLFVVQTSPPDGGVVPLWPRVANLWGVAEPGSEVKVDGRPVANVTKDGVFFEALFLGNDQTQVTVEARHGTRVARAVRSLPPR